MRFLTVIFLFRVIAPLLGFDRGLINSGGLVVIIITLFFIQQKLYYSTQEKTFLLFIGSIILTKTLLLHGESSLPMLEEAVRFVSYALIYGLTVRLDADGLKWFFQSIFYSLLFIGYYQIFANSGLEFEAGYGDSYISAKVVAGHAVNQNAFAVLLVLTGIFVLYKQQSYGKKVIGYLIFLFTLYLIFITGSRTALAAYIVGALAVLNVNKMNVLLSVVLLLPILIVINFDILSRNSLFSSKGLNSLFWRISAWSTLFADFNLSFLFLGELKHSVYEKLNRADIFATNEPHSDLVRAFYYFGLSGILPYLVVLKNVIVGGRNRIIVGILLSLLVISISENLYRDSNAIILLLLIVRNEGESIEQVRGNFRKV